MYDALVSIGYLIASVGAGAKTYFVFLDYQKSNYSLRWLLLLVGFFVLTAFFLYSAFKQVLEFIDRKKNAARMDFSLVFFPENEFDAQFKDITFCKIISTKKGEPIFPKSKILATENSISFDDFISFDGDIEEEKLTARLEEIFATIKKTGQSGECSLKLSKPPKVNLFAFSFSPEFLSFLAKNSCGIQGTGIFVA